MKLPALAIATAFALGIACGLSPAVTHRGSSHGFVVVLLCSAATSLLTGIVFAWHSRGVIAGLASLLCWAILGVAGVCIQEQPGRGDPYFEPGGWRENRSEIAAAILRAIGR